MEFGVVDIYFSTSYVLTGSMHPLITSTDKYFSTPLLSLSHPCKWLFAVPVCGLCERSLGSHVSLLLTPFKAGSGDKQG